jgi:hypothetical protein
MNETAPIDYASAPLKSIKPHLGRRDVVIILSLLASAAVFLAIFAWLPRTTEITGGNVSVVIILRPILSTLLPFVPLAGIALGIIAAAKLFRRQRFLFGAGVTVLVILGAVVAGLAAIVHSLGPWIIYDEVTASDGKDYCFIDSSFLQGQTMAIARHDASSLLYQTLTVLGTTNGDSPRSFINIQLPNPKTIPYGALYATPTGLLVGVRSSNDCYMVYDLNNATFYGHGDVERLPTDLLVTGSLRSSKAP